MLLDHLQRVLLGSTQSIHQSHAITFQSQDPICNIQVRNHIFSGVISLFQAFNSRDGTKEQRREKKNERELVRVGALLPPQSLHVFFSRLPQVRSLYQLGAWNGLRRNKPTRDVRRIRENNFSISSRRLLVSHLTYRRMKMLKQTINY